MARAESYAQVVQFTYYSGRMTASIWETIADILQIIHGASIKYNGRHLRAKNAFSICCALNILSPNAALAYWSMSIVSAVAVALSSSSS